MHKILRRADRQSIHHFEPRRDDAGGDDRPHGGTRLGHVIEGGEDDLGALRHWQQLDDHLDDDAEHAF